MDGMHASGKLSVEPIICVLYPYFAVLDQGAYRDSIFDERRGCVDD